MWKQKFFLEIRVKFGNEGKNWKTFGNKLEICKTIWNSEKHWKFEEKIGNLKKKIGICKIRN